MPENGAIVRLAMIVAGLLPVTPSHAAPVSASTETDRGRAVQCLAAAIAYEAGFEPLEGRQAVAEVVLNRVLDPAYPKTVCGVVFAGAQRRTGCQFTFTCDGALRRMLPGTVMEAARAIAIAALDGRNPVRAAGATHYHANYVMPYWAPSLVRVGKIGVHIFYRRRAGSRDQGLEPFRHAPRGEPVVTAALAGFAGAALPALPTPARGVEPIAAAPFAPWGLPIASR